MATSIKSFSNSPASLRSQFTSCKLSRAERKPSGSLSVSRIAAGKEACRSHPEAKLRVTRRESLSQQLALVVGLGSAACTPGNAAAAFAPPQGFRLHVDKLDGYRFIFPETWIPVTTSGNDVQYRNPAIVEENVFVNLSSPSSSKYKSVEDLGTPQQAADRLRKQYLEEFMSTRIGVTREAAVVSAEVRQAPDGKLYYDSIVQIKSYATRSQLAVTADERVQELEYDRKFITTLGVAQGRLYELRLQTASDRLDSQKDTIASIQQSFRCV